MSKREQARRDAAFARGDVGVDGEAVEQQQDPAEIERGKAREQYLRGKAFLGREFLTWLLWRSESSEPILEIDKDPLKVLVVGKVLLRGIAGEIVELSARGTMAAYSPLVRQALGKGMLVHQARLQLTHGEKSYEVTLDAEYLDVRSAKLPELMTDADDDQAQERLWLVEKLGALIDALVTAFLEVRLSRDWSKEAVPAMADWIDEARAAAARRPSRRSA